MTKTRLIGDVHGKKCELELMLSELPSDVSSIIQVGDMNVGFGQGDYWHESLDETLKSKNGRFIRGNHDNPQTCNEMETWIPDGKIENNMMFVGGAWSIDYARRVEGVSWWRDEELSYAKFEEIISVYDFVRPEIVITHDCPTSVSKKLFVERGRTFSKKSYETRTGSAFETMFNIHQPKVWIFGHWHFDEDEIVNGTRFICLNELSYCDLNVETLEVEFPLQQGFAT